jgi:transposase
MSTPYPSSLSDAEWDCLQRFLPPRSPQGKLRRHTLRSVFDALFYLVRTGCPWRYLPSSFPPWQTVYYHFRQFYRTGLWTHLWRRLHEAERQRVGKDPHPSAAIMDSQSVKTSRSRPAFAALTPASVLRVENDICSLIPWGSRSLFMSRPLTCTTHRVLVDSSQE